MNFQEAQNLLIEYVHKEEIKLHCLEVSTIMRFLARDLGKDEEKWAIAGLLHDLDYELFSNLEEHAQKTAEILKQKEKDFNEEIIHAILSHNEEHTHVKRESKLDYALASSDNVSGMIFAYGLMRKNLNEMEVKSLKKKMKEKSFAATVRRDLIYDIETLGNKVSGAQNAEHSSEVGINLDKFLEIAIKAMQSIAGKIGFKE